MKKILKILFLAFLIVSFGATIAVAKDCPKGLGFVEVQNLKLTCFYQEFDRGGNLVVRGTFANGVKKKDWGWIIFNIKNSSHYILSKSWTKNKIYANWKKSLEEINKIINENYNILTGNDGKEIRLLRK